jgi:choline-phosphate cytidylyltransferase
MPAAKQAPEYQQSSRDASEEDAGDDDSINSIYDSSADPLPASKSLKRKFTIPKSHAGADEGEISASTSDLQNAYAPRGKGKSVEDVKKVNDMVDGRYVDLNSAEARRMNPPPTDRPVRIYSDGIFDLFHIGYVVKEVCADVDI